MGVPYQVNIFSPDHQSPDAVMEQVSTALHSAGIRRYQEEEHADHAPHVFVDSDQLGAAIHAINDLGFTTDEDED